MEVKQKYIKDDDGNIISPVVSDTSIYNSDRDLPCCFVRAWCNAYWDTKTGTVSDVTIYNGCNIASIVPVNGYYAQFNVYYTNPLPNNYPAISVNVDITGMTTTNISVWGTDRTDYFGFEVLDSNAEYWDLTYNTLNIYIIVVC